MIIKIWFLFIISWLICLDILILVLLVVLIVFISGIFICVVFENSGVNFGVFRIVFIFFIMLV